jgi:ribonucleoside-diphosphate reductase beta chain
MTDELVLRKNPGRYVARPILYPNIWDLYKQHIACFWTAEEIDFSQDAKDFATLSDGDRYFIKHVLAFFAASDGIVMENVSINFSQEVQLQESRMFYSIQNAMESVHSDLYALQIEALVRDPKERNELFRAIETIPAVRRKAEWAQKWMGAAERSFAERLFAFTVVEGVFFSGSFCAIFWMKKRGKMPGLCFSNELISRDEGLHVRHACELYSMLAHKLSQSQVEAIMAEAVAVEAQFVCEALPVELIGMNSKSMAQYIEYVADRQLATMGYTRKWNSANPFDWMEMISLEGKGNFFELRISAYQRAGVMNGGTHSEFTTEAEF